VSRLQVETQAQNVRLFLCLFHFCPEFFNAISAGPKRLIFMKIHNNMNQMKSMVPTEAETQAAMKAAQKQNDIKTDNIATEKIKKFQDQVSKAENDNKNNSGSHPFPSELNAEKEPKENPSETPGNPPPPRPTGHIDFKV
jgi:hypothetical protein